MQKNSMLAPFFCFVTALCILYSYSAFYAIAISVIVTILLFAIMPPDAIQAIFVCESIFLPFMKKCRNPFDYYHPTYRALTKI